MNHRWSFDVRCAGCGKLCRVKVVEDPGPPFGGAPRRTYTASEGFNVTAGAPATIECFGCHTTFASPH